MFGIHVVFTLVSSNGLTVNTMMLNPRLTQILGAAKRQTC